MEQVLIKCKLRKRRELTKKKDIRGIEIGAKISNMLVAWQFFHKKVKQTWDKTLKQV